MHEELLVQATSIIALGVAAQWIAWRFNLPSILVLLTFGFIAGPITHLLDVEAVLGELLFPVVGLSVAVILFEGGLSLRLRDLLDVGGAGVLRRLLTVGVVITWFGVAGSAWLFIGLPFDLSLLLGAILVVTGPTVITPLLNQIRPSKRVGSILMWEGIVIDPVGAVLAVLMFEAIREGEGGLEVVILGFEITAVIGLGLGFAAARLLLWLVGNHHIPEFLENPIALLLVLSTFTVSNILQPESGLLTVTVLGVVLANQDFEIFGQRLGGKHSMSIQHIIEFKEILQVLLVSSLFIILSARIELEDFTALGFGTIIFIAVLVLVLRPLVAFVATWGSPLSRAERFFIAWMAPRGIVAAAVASVFVLELTEAGREDAARLSPIVFSVIIATVVIYGLSARPLAVRLGLVAESPQGTLIVGAHDWSRQIAQVLHEAGFQVLVVDTNYANIHQTRMLGLPVYYGSIMSDQAQLEMDLSGIGRLLALTSNDNVNALACLKYQRIFGRDHAYQLSSETPGGRQERIGSEFSGHILFGDDVNFAALERRFTDSWQLKTTPITTDFTQADYYRTYGHDAIFLFTIPRPERLNVVTHGEEPDLNPGTTVIALVPQDRIEAATHTTGDAAMDTALADQSQRQTELKEG